MNQFRIHGYKIFRSDCNRFGGGLMLYINQNIPFRLLSNHPIFSNLQLMTTEIHEDKGRCFFLGIYKSPSQSDDKFTTKLSYRLLVI